MQRNRSTEFKMKTVLFDIGNVLLNFDFAPALQSLQGPHADTAAYEKIIEQKDIFEAGKQSKNEYIAWASHLLDFQGSANEFEQAWVSIFTINTPMWHLAKKLKSQQYRLILFSNTNCIHAPYCMDKYSDFALFDGAIFSHEIGAIKPQKKFYTTAVEVYQLERGKTFYIDDLEANINMGREYGFTSFLYNSNNHDAFLSTFSKAITL